MTIPRGRRDTVSRRPFFCMTRLSIRFSIRNVRKELGDYLAKVAKAVRLDMLARFYEGMTGKDGFVPVNATPHFPSYQSMRLNLKALRKV